MYWFRGAITFDCPECKQPSVEMVIAECPDHDPAAVAQEIQRLVDPIVCQKCQRMLDPAAARPYLKLEDLPDEERWQMHFGSVPSQTVVN